MPLAVCVLITWLVIVIFSLIPKKLSELDMVILYFSNVIFELSIFTVLHINLRLVVVRPGVEHSIADLILRLIMVPLVFVITANTLFYCWKFLKWMIVAAIVLCFPLFEKSLIWLGIIETHHWNPGYNLLMMASYAMFSSFVSWVLTHLEPKEVKKA